MSSQPSIADTLVMASVSLWSTTGRAWEVALDDRKAWRCDVAEQVDDAAVHLARAVAVRHAAAQRLDAQLAVVQGVSAEALVLAKEVAKLVEQVDYEYDRQLVFDYSSDSEEEEEEESSDDPLAGMDFMESTHASRGELLREADAMLLESMHMSVEEVVGKLMFVESRFLAECATRDSLHADLDDEVRSAAARAATVQSLTEQLTAANDRVVAARKLLGTATSWDELKQRDVEGEAGRGTNLFFDQVIRADREGACSRRFVSELSKAALFGSGINVADVSHLRSPGSPLAFRHTSQRRPYDEKTLEDPSTLLRYELLSAKAVELGYSSPSQMRTRRPEPLRASFTDYRAGITLAEIAALAYVLHGFDERTALESLALSHTRIAGSTLAPLVAVLPRCHSLRVLDLSWNRIGRMSAAYSKATQRRNAEAEAAAVKADVASASAKEGDAKVGEGGGGGDSIEATVGAMKRQTDALSLEWASEGAALRDIFGAIQECKSLTSLDLRGNGICSVGAAILAETVLCSQTITDLNLSFNMLREDGAAALADGLAGNVVLVKLGLRSNAIRHAGAAAIAAAWESQRWGHRSIRALDVTDNKVGTRGAKAISAAVNISVLKIQQSFGVNPLAEARAAKDAEEAKEAEKARIATKTEPLGDSNDTGGGSEVRSTLVLDTLPSRSPQPSPPPVVHGAVNLDELTTGMGLGGGAAAEDPMAWSPTMRGSTAPADGYGGLAEDTCESSSRSPSPAARSPMTSSVSVKGRVASKVASKVANEKSGTSAKVDEGFEAEDGFEVELN